MKVGKRGLVEATVGEAEDEDMAEVGEEEAMAGEEDTVVEAGAEAMDRGVATTVGEEASNATGAPHQLKRVKRSRLQ